MKVCGDHLLLLGTHNEIGEELYRGSPAQVMCPTVGPSSLFCNLLLHNKCSALKAEI